MGYSRFVFGFLAGCGVMYGTLVLSPLQPQRSTSVPLTMKTSEDSGGSLPVQALPVERTAASRPSVGIDTRVLPDPEPSTLPTDAEILLRLERAGITRQDAQAALDKFGSVKMNAILEHEERLRASEQTRPSDLDADEAPGAVSSVVAQAKTAQRSATENARATDAQDDANPYEALLRTQPSNAEPGSDEATAAYRKTKAVGYLESVHNAESEILHNSQNGLACSGANCLAPR